MADPPGYFVGRPLHPQEQAAPPPPQNSVGAQVPGYYAGPVQASPQPAASPAPNSAPVSATNGSAAQGNENPGLLARLFAGCFSPGGTAS